MKKIFIFFIILVSFFLLFLIKNDNIALACTNNSDCFGGYICLSGTCVPPVCGNYMCNQCTGCHWLSSWVSCNSDCSTQDYPPFPNYVPYDCWDACEPTPAPCGGTCVGCQICSIYGACADDDYLCPSGEVCTGGACVGPTSPPAGPTPTPLPGSPPTITSLKTSMSSGPTPVNGYTFSGTFGYSGATLNEGGYNWYNNWMIVRLDAALGVGGSHGTNVDQFAVGFYDKSLGLATSLNDLKNKLYSPSPYTYPTKGFLFSLGYIAGAPTPPWFYAFDNSTGFWIYVNNSFTSDQFLPSAAPGFVPLAVGGSISPAPYYGVWAIYMTKNFGSKNMYTAVYAADDAGNTTFSGNFTVTQ